MSGGQVGLKAHGLCLEPLLQHGIPSSNVISSIIAEIDDTLTHNNRQLEECVRDLMTMSTDLTGHQNPANPMEALEQLLESKILDKASCYDPNPGEVTLILKQVVQQLETAPGCEVSMLQRLLELSSEQGLSLPPVLAGSSSGTDQSMTSVNTVPDQQEQQNVQMWNDACRKLRQCFLDRLSKLPVGKPGPPIDVHSGKRLEYVQSLCVLYQVSEVWNKYFSLRSQQLETLFPQTPPLLTAVPPQKTTKDGKPEEAGPLCPLVAQLETIASSMVTMIQQDFELLVSGVFKEATTMFRALQELYLDRLSEELCSVAIALQMALPAITALPKSTSEVFRLTHHQKPPLTKQLSRSLDNLAAMPAEAAPPKPKTESHQPKTQLEALVRLVNCVLGIDNYIETLHSATTWEVTGPRKAPPKSTLKSALKPTSPEPPNPPLIQERRESKPFSPRSFEMSGLLPEAIPPPFGATDAMAGGSGNRRGAGPHQEDRPHWDWQRPFRKLIADIAKVVETHLRACTEHCQKVLNSGLTEQKAIETMVLPSGLVGGRLDYAKKVSKAVWELVSEMEWLLPLAAAGCRGPFEVVRASFVDAVTLSLKDISVTLSKVSTEVSEKSLAMPCLYTTLSTAACVRNHLLHFDNVLGSEETNKKRFSTPYRHYCDLVDTLARQVIEYHTQLLVSSLLNDAESHDWSSNKEFYEDERCSFGVPMWHLHMSALQHDLWTSCPPKLAQSILTAVLHDTLMAFVQRYSKAKPSYKRTRQFRRDITLILLVTSELLYPVTGSPTRYLDVSLAHQASYSIHTLASCLLGTMAVVTSPIDILYKVFKKGFHRKRSKGEVDPLKGYPSHWLAWIRPAVFPYGVRSYDNLQTTTALYVQVKLLMSQPEINWPMLLQALLMKEYTLSIMLLTRTSQRLTSHMADEDAHAALMAAGLEIFTAFVDVLTKCADYPAALTKVLCPVLDRTNSWGLFDAKAIIGKTHPIPPWIEAIFTTLNSFVVRVINPAVRVILEHERSGPEVASLVADMAELPCGCDLASKDEEEGHTSDMLGEAMYSLVTQLVEDVYTLPAPLCMLFRALQDSMNEHEDVSAPHDCVGLKLVASSIRLMLSDVGRIGKLVREPLSEASQDSLKMLAECTYHVLTAVAFGKGSGTPRIAGLFMKANRNWLMEQVEILTDHFSNEIFLLPDTPPFKNDPQEFVENQLITTASFILHTDTGPCSLEKVYNFTLNNVRWILAQLDIPPLIGGVQSPDAAPDFLLNVSMCEPKPFNPLVAFDHIGGIKIDQEILADWPYPWASLLQSDLGLTEVTFSRLLYQRHEMQEGAYLEEKEMRPVQGLRAKFEMEPVDLV